MKRQTTVVGYLFALLAIASTSDGASHMSEHRLGVCSFVNTFDDTYTADEGQPRVVLMADYDAAHYIGEYLGNDYGEHTPAIKVLRNPQHGSLERVSYPTFSGHYLYSPEKDYQGTDVVLFSVSFEKLTILVNYYVVVTLETVSPNPPMSLCENPLAPVTSGRWKISVTSDIWDLA